MTVKAGESVSAAIVNAAFVSREEDSNTTGKIDLINDDVISGAHVTNVQKTINDITTSASDNATAINDHIIDTEDAHDSSAISYDNAASGMTANEVKSAIDENHTDIGTNTTNIGTNDTDIGNIQTDITNKFNTTTGHDHDGTDSKKVIATNLDDTGSVADQVLVSDGAGGLTWEDQSGGGGGDFVSLTDTPSDYTGQAGKAAIVNVGETALEFGDVTADFTGLTDTPSNYTGSEHKLVAVNEAGDALEFIPTPNSDPSVYAFFNAENGFVATTGNNALFNNGGTMAGTLALSTTNPLNGVKSYLYTQVSGSLNDWMASESIPLPLRSQKSEAHVWKFVFEYSGDVNDIQANIWDETNSSVVTTKMISELDGKFSLVFGLPSTCVNIKLGFHTKVENIGATFKFDDNIVSDKAFEYGSVTTSETIEFTGYTSISSLKIKLKTIRQDGGDKLLSQDNTGSYTKIIANSNLKHVIFTGSVNGAAAVTSEIRLYNSSDVEIKRVKDRDSSGEGDSSMAMITSMDEGDYAVLFSGAAALDTTGTQFSATATAKSDSVLFEDTRSQAHFVGKAIYNLSSLSSTSSTSYVLPSFSLSSSSVSGGVEQNTANAPSITIPNAKVGTYKILVTGMLGSSDGRYCASAIYDGSSYYSEQSSYAGYMSTMEFDYPCTSVGDLDLDLVIKVNTGSYNIDPTAAPVELSVTYLPPVEQANVPTLMALPQSKETELNVTSNSSGVFSEYNGESEWVSFVSKGGSGEYNCILNTNIFSVYPKMWGNGIASGAHRVAVSTDGYTFPAFRVNTKADNNYADLPFVLFASKSTPDRTPQGVWAGNVAKERVMEVYHHPTTARAYVNYSATNVTLPLDRLGHSVFGSLSANRITFSKGEMIWRVNFGTSNGAGYGTLSLYDNTSSTTIIEKIECTYSEASAISYVTVDLLFEAESGHEYELRGRCSGSSGFMWLVDGNVRKLS